MVLVVSELVTNALRHGGGTYTLRLTAHPDLIEVAVDRAPTDAHPRLMAARDTQAEQLLATVKTVHDVADDMRHTTGARAWARALDEILDGARRPTTRKA